MTKIDDEMNSYMYYNFGVVVGSGVEHYCLVMHYIYQQNKVMLMMLVHLLVIFYDGSLKWFAC